jgi:hypothetical protein
MPLFGSTTPCAVCGDPIGSDHNNILGFDFITEQVPLDFLRFGDAVAHVSCLSRWERRDEFIEAWNRALSEYFAGKALRIGANHRVEYTDSAGWRIQHSPAVQRRTAEQWAQITEESRSRRENLAARMEAARQKALDLGLASPAELDRVISNLSRDEFFRDFAEFKVSRAFFKGR